MPERAGHDDRRTAVAVGIQRTVERRAAFNQAVGVLRCQWHCTGTEARDELHYRFDQVTGGCDGEAARVVAAVNAAANGRSDPDLG